MNTSPRHIDHPAAAALDGDAGLCAALDLYALAEVGLTAGPQARRAALAALEWLQGQVEDGVTLEQALGLSAPGRTHGRRRLRQMHRDAALRRLWWTQWPSLGPTAAAGLIATHWARYAASAWPRHRDAGTEPTDDPEVTLHRLMAAGHKLLAAETLRRVLSGAIGQFPPVELTRTTDDLDP